LAKQKESKQDKKSTPYSDGTSISQELLASIKQCQALPTPDKNKYWQLEPIPNIEKKNKKLFGLIKKKGLKEDEIKELRQAAIHAPGNTKVRIQKLQKKFPNDPVLLMLSAICQQGMIINSSSQKEVLTGLEKATKDAALALLSDGISLYNIESFFKIYYIYIDRFKRQQLRTYEQVRIDPRLESYRKQLQNSMQMVDYLGSDKKKSLNILAHLKKKLKTSHYTTVFKLQDISMAGQAILKGRQQDKFAIGTAKELIAFIYAMSIAFARIPILNPLTEQIMEKMPDTDRILYLRRVSIRSVRFFTQFRLHALEGEPKKMAELGKQIFKENWAAIQKMEGQALYQIYESDPYFNLAFVAELTVGMYDSKLQTQIQATALKAVETVIQRDMSKNHIFTEAANNHTHKLVALKEDANT